MNTSTTNGRALSGASIGRSGAIRAGFGALVAGALFLGTAGTAAAYPEVVVRTAPPAPRYEMITGAPSPHHFWVGGYWGYHAHGGYYWNGGHWAAPRQGYRYEPAHWNARGGAYHFSPGYWHHR
jgi:hypothetical protein